MAKRKVVKKPTRKTMVKSKRKTVVSKPKVRRNRSTNLY